MQVQTNLSGRVIPALLTLNDLVELGHEEGAGRYVFEASTLFGNLGYEPCEWPPYFEVKAWGRIIRVRRCDWLAKFSEDEDRELISMHYSSCGDGLIECVVFND